MAKLDGLESVLEFIKGLQPKIAAQTSKKVLMLNLDPLPADSKALKGYEGYYRVDSGEYRIVVEVKLLGSVLDLWNNYQTARPNS
jgi:mRNA interferase RelE/StbE